MLVNTIVRKDDNGFRGTLITWDDPAVIQLGMDLFNRNFKPYAKGVLMDVVFNVTPTGRRVVKSIKARYEEEEPTHMVSLGDATIGLELKAERDVEETIREFLEEHAKKLVSGGKVDPARISEVIDEEVAAWAGKPVEVTKLSSDEVIERAVFGTPEQQEAAERVAEKRSQRKAKSDRAVVDGYYVSQEARLVFNTAKKLSDAKPERAVKVMMVGASGYGKTTLPKLFSELVGKKFLRMNCATIRDPEEWFGYREARDGTTVFIPSQFGREIQEGNLVVVLDEFNRLEPWLHNTLFPLLDDDGATVVHDEEFKIGPGVIVVGTINTGYKYTGTFELDEALFNRFDFTLEVGPMPYAEEVKVLTKRTGIDKDKASAVVKMSNILRQNDVVCSTRTSLLVSAMIEAGMNLREAFESAVVRRIPADSSNNSLRKQVVDLINVQLGPLEERVLDEDIFAPVKSTKSVQKPELLEEAQETGGKTPVLKLRHNKGKELLFISVVSLFRQLPLALDKGGRVSIGIAHELADQLRKGEEIELPLTHKPDNLNEIVESLRGAGLTGSFSFKS